MAIKCELIVNSDVEHLRQIYTGFSLLHQKNFLELTQTIPAEFLQNKKDSRRWVNYKFYNAKVILNDQITVCYDLHDWSWIDEEILSETDFYFKRSYDGDFVARLKDGKKVFPLGLNYPVASFEKDVFQMQRAAFYAGKEKLKALVKSLHLKKYAETEQLTDMESYPPVDLPPKVLFMARAWDTNSIEDKSQKEAVAVMNERRAECVRRLRKEFGQAFFGGLAIDDYSTKHFKDALLPDETLSKKRQYLEILKTFPVCVATTGLSGSNGWKLGEYVAFARAIISEPLVFQLPGDFANGKNYLEFVTPEDSVESVTRLFENKNLRSEMMVNNFRYYRSFVRPDAMILNSLLTVFQHGGKI